MLNCLLPLLPFKEPQGEQTQYGWALQSQEWAGALSGRAGEGLEETAWEGRLSSCSPSFSYSLEAFLEVSCILDGPQALPHTLTQVSSAGNRATQCGQWAGHSFPATSPFALRAAQAGLDWAGGSRFQHSRGAQGGQAPGIGVGKRLTHQCPEAS